MSTIGDLTKLAQLDSVEVVPVDDASHVAESVPKWCEIVLKLESNGGIKNIPLSRHDGELIIECLHNVLHPGTGRKSPLSRLWAELDDTMIYLMADDDPEPEDKATARSLALAIALITQPYAEEPDVSAVRDEAVRRWEESQ